MMASDEKAVDVEKFEKQIVRLASDSAASEQNRITAVRLAGMCGIHNAHSAVREMAQTGETESLRAAAIATLGEIGDETDRELLLSIANGTDTSLGDVAKRAVISLSDSLAEKDDLKTRPSANTSEHSNVETP
jgi:HEAT repeat protein